MSQNEMVDVLIVGSGASGAAVAWSLAETRMRILCLEQGDWMKHADFPSNGHEAARRVPKPAPTLPTGRVPYGPA
jgi:choline dehydrogenase-like flavoprotein